MGQPLLTGHWGPFSSGGNFPRGVIHFFFSSRFNMSSDLRSFQQHLVASRKVLAILGAGLSATSGLPTFRGAGGLWKKYDAIELATPEAFEMDPSLVWQFYSARRKAALAAKPHKGHKALAKLAERRGPRFLTLTQNVDGLSERAHHPRDGLVHLHGDLFTLLCTSFSCRYVEKGNFDDPLTPALANANWDDDIDAERIAESQLPRCPKCNSLLRPGVVWFGETLPYDAIRRADDYISAGDVDLVLVVGTSATVWPAAGYIEEVAQRGGKVAVFNIDESTKWPDGWFFQGDSAEWLPEALQPLIGKI